MTGEKSTSNKIFFGALAVLGVLADTFGVYQGMRDIILNGFSGYFWKLFIICFLSLIFFIFIIKTLIPNFSIAKINFLDLCAGVYALLIVACSSLTFYNFFSFQKFDFFEMCGYFLLLIFSLLLFLIPQFFSKNPETIFHIISYFLGVKTLTFFIFLIYYIVEKIETGSSLLLFLMTAYSGIITIASLFYKQEFPFNYDKFFSKVEIL